MEKIVLNATRRSVTGKQVGALRRAGKLPGVLYGHKFESTPITLDTREVIRVLGTTSPTTLITINLDGKEHATLVREKQRHFAKNQLLHVDFQVVSLTEKIRADVSIEFEGIAPAVKDYNGVVVTGLSALHVESLPQDLPARIIVDITGLTKIGDSILVRDLKISDKVTVHAPEDEMVVIITGVAEEVEATEEGGPAEPEVIERGKKEEDFED